MVLLRHPTNRAVSLYLQSIPRTLPNIRIWMTMLSTGLHYYPSTTVHTPFTGIIIATDVQPAHRPECTTWTLLFPKLKRLCDWGKMCEAALPKETDLQLQSAMRWFL